jgi:hypothetical protein
MGIHDSVKKAERSPLFYILVAFIAVSFGLPAAAFLSSGGGGGEYVIAGEGVSHGQLEVEARLLEKWGSYLQRYNLQMQYMQYQQGVDVQDLIRMWQHGDIVRGEQSVRFAAEQISVFKDREFAQSEDNEPFMRWAIARRALLLKADELGIAPTDDAVREFIYALFGGTLTGEQFKQAAPQIAGMSSENFELMARQALKMQTFLTLATEHVFVSSDEVYNRFLDEYTKYVCTYVEFDAEAYKGMVDAPTAEEIQKYYNEHKEEYRIPEKRQIQMLWAPDENFTEQVAEPSEEAIEAYYNEHKYDKFQVEKEDESGEESPEDGPEESSEDGGDESTDENGRNDGRELNQIPGVDTGDSNEEPAQPGAGEENPEQPAEETPADETPAEEQPADTDPTDGDPEDANQEPEFKALADVRTEIVDVLKLEGARAHGLLAFQDKLQNVLMKWSSEGKELKPEQLADEVDGEGGIVFTASTELERDSLNDFSESELHGIFGAFESDDQRRRFQELLFDEMNDGDFYNYISQGGRIPFRTTKGWFTFKLVRTIESRLPDMSSSARTEIEATLRKERAEKKAKDEAAEFLKLANEKGWIIAVGEKGYDASVLKEAKGFTANGTGLEMEGAFNIAGAVKNLEDGDNALVLDGVKNPVVIHLTARVDPGRKEFEENEESIRARLIDSRKNEARRLVVQTIAEKADITMPEATLVKPEPDSVNTPTEE